MEKRPRVLLGMSGGVDSSVSAILLLEQGYEVIGAFMKNWSEKRETEGDERETRETKEECSWRTERRDAMRVAAQLGIELHTFDYEDEYRENVYEYMIREYEAGRTPNPDVLCNKYMKFGYLLEEAKKLDCDFIATGHYARSAYRCGSCHVFYPVSARHACALPGAPETTPPAFTHLLSGRDPNKDQSYFLCQLEQDQLKKVLFPIGELQKSEVRDLAKKHDLHVCDKKDSQGICFVGKVKMQEFLSERIPENAGNIVTTSGEVIGQHKGHAYYTIGQRTGLGIGGGTPYFIVERRPEKNEIVVAVGEDDPALMSSELVATNVTETIPGNLQKYFGKKIKARVRYRQPLQDCVLEECGMLNEECGVKVIFDQKQRAVAPGQFVAFYDGEELIGSGVIDRAD